jgi:predicted ribonuclease YlaK
LTPTVLSELDQLKINHRNPDVRDKAERLIRQVKEYRRRGRLADGVPIVAGVSTLQTIATEPKLEDSLPWLDPANNDDRFIAAVLEVMRLRPRAPVVLISRDINLQNKAEFAGLPFVEPPEP